jgi:hypothetical protein
LSVNLPAADTVYSGVATCERLPRDARDYEAFAMTHRVISVCAFLLAVVMVAPAVAQSRGDRDRDRGPVETETVDRTLALQPGGTVRLTTFSGRVNITGRSGSDVVIKAVRRATRDRLDSVELLITQNGSVVTIDANENAGGRRDDDNVVETDFDIQVPAQVDLELRTFSAPVTVTGVSGDLDVDGFSSEVRLTDVAGPVRVETFSGAVTLEARSWMEGDDVDITTFSGGVNLRLPDSARGDITFDGFSGGLESDLPVTLTSSSRRSLRGALNGGGTTEFRFKTFSGPVRIRR